MSWGHHLSIYDCNIASQNNKTHLFNVEQNIAYKIVDEFEKPVDADLEIFNNKNEKIAETSAYNFGMGSFLFTPKNGETYFAKVKKHENTLLINQLSARTHSSPD